MIGLFDSGIGGLTVLKSLQQQFPQEKFIYLGDTARLPYGTKSPETIRRYTEQNIRFLEKKGVQGIVSACHSASSAILQFQMQANVPLYNVITPACVSAQQKSRSQKIALLATQATVEAGQYQKQIQSPYQLFSMPAPLLVSVVEAGWSEDPLTEKIIERYLEPLLKEDVDVIILGCTHFPLLKKPLQKVAGPKVQLVDPGETLARQMSQQMTLGSKGPGLEIYLTDRSPHFLKTAESLLEIQGLQIDPVDL